MTIADLERFLSKVVESDGHWLWTGCLDKGYGRFRHEGETRQAHRVAYEHFVGPIPDGMHLDHLCRIPGCVNPEHLQPVTARENVRRGLRGVLRTHCTNGHRYTPETTGLWNGYRYCRVCKRAQQRRFELTRRPSRRLAEGSVS